MKKNFLFSIVTIAVALISSSAMAASDLACNLNQNANQASGNIAALLSRGYLAAGQQYTSDGGGVDGDGNGVSSEHINLGHFLYLYHKTKGNTETYEIVAEFDANMSDQEVFDALLAVSNKAAKTLSKDDAAALMECNHLLGQYIGVSPQPDHP
jgi:hypothetical protein